MKVGIVMFVTAYSIDIVTLARKAEALGFESLFIPEHPVIPAERATPWPGSADGVLPDYYKHTLDPFVALGAAAVATERLQIGTGICLVPERNPLLTAKEVATVDRISGGRFHFGVGAGWLREESELFGVDFPRRWAQTGDYVKAMQACWTSEPAEYHGPYADFPAVHVEPKPVQKPYPPVLIAGEGDKAAARIAEYGDGWIPRGRSIDPDGLAAGRKRVEQALRDAGRDTGRLTVSLFGAPQDRESNRRFFDAGADRVLHMLPTEDEASATARLEQLARDVL